MKLSKKEMGKLIKKAREIKGKSLGKKFTQKDLAEAIGKSPSYIGDFEYGKTYPNEEILGKIAAACGVSKSFFTYQELNKDFKEFTTATEAFEFILKQPAVMGYAGLDINKMKDDDIVSFANDLLQQLKLLSYKYK